MRVVGTTFVSKKQGKWIHYIQNHTEHTYGITNLILSAVIGTLLITAMST